MRYKSPRNKIAINIKYLIQIPVQINWDEVNQINLQMQDMI